MDAVLANGLRQFVEAAFLEVLTRVGGGFPRERERDLWRYRVGRNSCDLHDEVLL